MSNTSNELVIHCWCEIL